jgi:hypothetical protein
MTLAAAAEAARRKKENRDYFERICSHQKTLSDYMSFPSKRFPLHPFQKVRFKFLPGERKGLNRLEV